MSLLARIQKPTPDKQENLKRNRLMQSLVESIGFDRLFDIASRPEDIARAELGIEIRRILESDDFIDVLSHEYQSLTKRVIDNIIGYGPLQDLMDDPAVTEIMVNGADQIYVEIDGRVRSVPDKFDDDAQVRHVIDRMIAPVGRRIDERTPLVNARLSNGFRINAVIPPVAIDGTALTIRKFKQEITSLSQLVSLKSMDENVADFLEQAVMSRLNIAVVGGTGSGKTTLLNALSTCISPDERIVTIEDSAELQFSHHPHVVRLEKRDASIEGIGEVSIRDLVINALRMRPDRIIVGECRGEEALDMLQAMNTGHDGSLTTLHAGSAQEAVLRVIMMVRYGIELPTSVIKDQIASAIDLFVIQGRRSDGRRIITSVTECLNSQEGEVDLVEHIRYSSTSNTWDILSQPDAMEECVS